MDTLNNLNYFKSSKISIPNNEVHIWMVRDQEIKDQELLAEYFRNTCTTERIKYAKFHFYKHRHQYLVTRALVRSVLSLYCNDISPSEWTFKTNNYGRPEISNRHMQNLKFNISHTDKSIVLAVALDCEVGVDIEWILRTSDILDISDNFFSPIEAAQLNALNAPLKNSRFFDLWTLKEAYIKARGMGLAIPLHEFSFLFDKPKTVSISFSPSLGDDSRLWQFWRIAAGEDSALSLAIKTKGSSPPFLVRMMAATPMHSYNELDCTFLLRSDTHLPLYNQICKKSN